MNSKERVQRQIFLSGLLIMLAAPLLAQEVFIYRPHLKKKVAAIDRKVSIGGEYFAYLLAPGNFPSYNDLKGKKDRWNFGFQNFIFLTENTRLLAQLVTHDDGDRRTKFDWHFSLRHNLFKNLTLIIGHDSNHDSDYQSTLHGKKFFLNRNYIGAGFPFVFRGIYLEPVTWFFHHTNQRVYWDYSGNEVQQEYGLRMGALIPENLTFSFQLLSQTDSLFSKPQSYLADLMIRYKVFAFLELCFGGCLWKDIQESPLKRKHKYYIVRWGVVIPF